MQNIYSEPTTDPTGDHNEAIESLQAITQGMQYQQYEIDLMAQENAVLIRTNSAVMAQLLQLTKATEEIKSQPKTL